MGIVNRRNAVLGWGVWKVAKRFGKQKARGRTGERRARRTEQVRDRFDLRRPRRCALVLAQEIGRESQLL